MVPDDCEKAQVFEIFKKGDKSLAGNYRPVSLLHVDCVSVNYESNVCVDI
jgi:hypothetical protein